MPSATVQIKTQQNADFMDRVRELQGRAQNRLSSGNRMATPSDDPVGLGLVEKMAAQSRRLGAAQTNAQNAISLTQAADGFLASLGNLVSRMSELAQYAADPSKNGADSLLYQTEFRQLQEQLRNTIGGPAGTIGGQAVTRPLGMFNGNILFQDNPNGLTFMVGKAVGDSVVIPEMDFNTGAMLSVIAQDGAGNFLLDIDDHNAISTLVSAQDQIGDARSTLGAARARLDIAVSQLTKESENLEDSISNLRDVDISVETTRLAKYGVLAETSTAMLAQAAAAPQAILQLLRGS